MTDPKRPEDADELAPDDGDADEQTAEAPDELDQADELDEADDFDDAADSELSESEFVNAATPADRPTAPMSSRDRAAAARAAAKLPATPATDELPYVDDRVSKIWVAAIAATFLLILLYGLFLGNNGILIGVPTPIPSEPPPSFLVTPEPSASPAPSGTPGASGTPAPSGTPGASGTAGSSGSPGPSASPAPSSTSSGPTLPPSPTAGPT